jgi:hypothetical protein
MNKQLLTGLTIIGVAGSAGAAYAGVSVINSASAQNPPNSAPVTTSASTQPQTPVTRTVVYQVGAAGQVTLAVTGEQLAVNGSAAAAGWSVGGAGATGRHAEVQFTDGTQLVTFLADLVDGQIVVSVTNVVAGAAAPGLDVSVLSDSGTSLPRPAVTPPSTPATTNPGHAGTTAPSSSGDDDDDEDHEDEDHDDEDHDDEDHDEEDDD